MVDEEDSENGREHLKKSRKHLEKGTEAFVKQGIQKGKEKTGDVKKYKEYYQNNRSDLIEDITSGFFGSKEPAKVGIIVLLPLLVTLYAVSWVLDKLNAIPGNELLNITNYYILNQSIKLGFILIVSAVVVTGVGRFVRTSLGFKTEKTLDTVMDKIPFLGSVYNITKVTTDTIMSGAEEFNKPVKLKFNGIRVTGFKTGNTTEDGRDIVFVPTAPNITSGFVIEPDPEKVKETDESVEESLTRVLSAGFGNSNGEESKKRNLQNQHKFNFLLPSQYNMHFGEICKTVTEVLEENPDHPELESLQGEVSYFQNRAREEMERNNREEQKLDLREAYRRAEVYQIVEEERNYS